MPIIFAESVEDTARRIAENCRASDIQLHVSADYKDVLVCEEE